MRKYKVTLWWKEDADDFVCTSWIRGDNSYEFIYSEFNADGIEQKEWTRVVPLLHVTQIMIEAE